MGPNIAAIQLLRTKDCIQRSSGLLVRIPVGLDRYHGDAVGGNDHLPSMVQALGVQGDHKH